MPEVLATAIDTLYRQRFLEDCNRAYAKLKANPEAWREELAERKAWDSVPADEHGNRPAVAFARVSIARSIIRDRQAAGLSQQELARRAGVRQETVSRIESGKHSPTVRTVEKVDRVLQRVLKKSGKLNDSKKPT